MLEAFGKGASADIRRAKAILYHQITNDPGVESSDGAALTTENVEVAESEMNITSPMVRPTYM